MGTYIAAELFLQEVFGGDFRSKGLFANLNPPFHTRDLGKLDEARDCYWSIAAFGPSAKTNTGEGALEVRALVVDDVYTKVPPGAVALALGAPTAVVETSLGNQQWVYRLSTPVAVGDWRAFFEAVEKMIGVKLEGRGPQHLFRLPMGVNSKPGRDGFAVRSLALNAGERLDPKIILQNVSENAKTTAIPSGGSSGPEPRVHDIGRLLGLIPNDDVPYDEWMDVLQRTKAISIDDAEEAIVAWSAKSAKHNEAECRHRWGTVKPDRTNGLLLLRQAEEADPDGFKAFMDAEAREVFDEVEPPAAAVGGGGYSVTHMDMAAEIVRVERGGLGWLSNAPGHWAAFDPVMGRWVVEMHDKLMRAAVRNETWAARARADEKTARKLAEAKWLGSVQSLLVKHSDLMIPFDAFDADLEMFGVPGGVVRLGVGSATEEPGAAAQMVSRSTSIRPAPAGTKGVAWEAFLDDFTMGDTELRAWWQAFMGYCLTGHTNEHMVVFLYGPGGNGKSVFLDTVGEVLGPYHERAASTLFMASSGSKHMAMVADLVGARLVTSPDVPLGASWDLGMLKPLTGGGTFKAQFMRENWFKFVPQFKLILAGNEKPVLGAVDAAVRRRFWLVPAMHVPAVVNRNLVDVLRAEGPAILRWMLDGWEAYSAFGLPRCRRIEQETADYLDEQDTWGKWVGLTLQPVPGDLTRHRITDLWNMWDAFRASEGCWKASPISKNAISTKLREAGFNVDRDKQGAYVDQISVTKSTTSVF